MVIFMKKLVLFSLLLAASQYSFAEDSCFPDPVQPGAFLGDASGFSSRHFMQVLEIQGCWLQAKQCKTDDEGKMQCWDETAGWFHVSKIEPFNIKPQ